MAADYEYVLLSPLGWPVHSLAIVQRQGVARLGCDTSHPSQLGKGSGSGRSCRLLLPTDGRKSEADRTRSRKRNIRIVSLQFHFTDFQTKARRPRDHGNSVQRCVSGNICIQDFNSYYSLRFFRKLLKIGFGCV